VLDEPTNHLDMRSKDILKSALVKYDGTLILVSHDRDFLNGVVGTVYEFRNKKMRQHLGGIADFLYKKKLETLNELNRLKKRPAQAKSKNQSGSKLKYEERKELDKKIRKAKKLVSDSEANILKLESDIERMDSLLANPENIEDHTVFGKYEQLKSDLEAEMHNWEKLSHNLDELKELKA
jgi:ATP-binding cassette subfamily F protein 3